MTRKPLLVSKIDTDKLSKLLYWKAVEAGSDSYPEGELMAVVNTEKGIATVCSEGVGWWKGEKGYLVGGWIGYSNPTYYITEDELISVISHDVMEFSDFVRSFGGRLETNYDLWYAEAHGYSQHPQRVKEQLLKCQTPVVA